MTQMDTPKPDTPEPDSPKPDTLDLPPMTDPTAEGLDDSSPITKTSPGIETAKEEDPLTAKLVDGSFSSGSEDVDDVVDAKKTVSPLVPEIVPTAGFSQFSRHSPQKKKGSSVESVGGPIGSGRPVASGSGDGSTVPKSDSDANVDDKN